MDLIDCLMMIITYVEYGINELLNPIISGAKWVDNVHFIINEALLILVTAIVVGYFAGFLGVYIAIGLGAAYAVICGLWLHAIVTIVLFFAFNDIVGLIAFILFAILLVFGGVKVRLDIIGWIGVWLKWMVDSGFFWWVYGLKSMSERFARFSFGGRLSGIPAVFTQLFVFYISKTAFLILAIFLGFVLLYPLIVVIEVLIAQIFNLVQGFMWFISLYRLYKLREWAHGANQKLDHQDDRLRKLERHEQKRENAALNRDGVTTIDHAHDE
jgi:hypothetical protein